MLRRYICLLFLLLSSCKTSIDTTKISFKTKKRVNIAPLILVNEKQPNRFIKNDSTRILYPVKVEIVNKTGKDLKYGMAILFDPFQDYTNLSFFEKEGKLIYGKNFFRKNKMVIRDSDKEEHLFYIEMLVPNESVEFLNEEKKKLQISESDKKVFKNYYVKRLKQIDEKFINFRNNLMTMGVNEGGKYFLLVYCLDKDKYVIRDQEYLDKQHWKDKISCE